MDKSVTLTLFNNSKQFWIINFFGKVIKNVDILLYIYIFLLSAENNKPKPTFYFSV